MLALREKSHYYVTSNLYMLPKIYAITFCANVKVLLAIVTLHNSLSLYVPFFIAEWLLKSVLIKQKCVTTLLHVTYVILMNYTI